MLQVWSVQPAEDNLTEEFYGLKKASRITQSQENTVNIEFQVSGPDLSIQAGMCIRQNEIYI